MTNLEWVRTLSAEELAKLFDDTCEMCIHQHGDCDNCSCTRGYIEWLRKEHTEEKPIDCPHCGCSVITTYKDLNNIAYAECCQCGALVKDVEGNLDRAIRKWNRRVNDGKVDGDCQDRRNQIHDRV